MPFDTRKTNEHAKHLGLHKLPSHPSLHQEVINQSWNEHSEESQYGCFGHSNAARFTAAAGTTHTVATVIYYTLGGIKWLASLINLSYISAQGGASAVQMLVNLKLAFWVSLGATFLLPVVIAGVGYAIYKLSDKLKYMEYYQKFAEHHPEKADNKTYVKDHLLHLSTLRYGSIAMAHLITSLAIAAKNQLEDDADHGGLHATMLAIVQTVRTGLPTPNLIYYCIAFLCKAIDYLFSSRLAEKTQYGDRARMISTLLNDPHYTENEDQLRAILFHFFTARHTVGSKHLEFKQQDLATFRALNHADKAKLIELMKGDDECEQVTKSLIEESDMNRKELRSLTDIWQKNNVAFFQHVTSQHSSTFDPILTDDERTLATSSGVQA